MISNEDTIIVTVLFFSIKNHCYLPIPNFCKFNVHAQNLPAQNDTVRVTEVLGQVRQTYFQSVMINLSTFHNLCFDHQPLLGKMIRL